MRAHRALAAAVGWQGCGKAVCIVGMGGSAPAAAAAAVAAAYPMKFSVTRNSTMLHKT